MAKIEKSKSSMEKPKIEAKAFGDLRLKFITDRLNQYAERKGITTRQVQDFINDTPNRNSVTVEIDSVVDIELHSTFLPDPSKFHIV